MLLVDDSIVRGTTSHEIVQMARDAGTPRKCTFASAAPAVRFPNVYGHDMPMTRAELLATNRDDVQIAAEIGAGCGDLSRPGSAQTNRPRGHSHPTRWR